MNGSTPIGRSCARAPQCCKRKPSGNRMADVTTCCCRRASSLSARVACLLIPATSPPTTSGSLSHCHPRARRPSASKERTALARDEAQVAEIKAAQTLNAAAQPHRASAADHTLGLCRGGSGHSDRGCLQWDKARQLATKEAELSAEQTSNATLTNSLNKRQADLEPRTSQHSRSTFRDQTVARRI